MSFVLLDLFPLFNNDGISWDHYLEDGDFDGEGGPIRPKACRPPTPGANAGASLSSFPPKRTGRSITWPWSYSAWFCRKGSTNPSIYWGRRTAAILPNGWRRRRRAVAAAGWN